MLRLSSRLALVLLLAGLGACTKTEPPKAPRAFATHWQDETQFIVESTILDLTEMAFYAKHGAAIDVSGKTLQVEAQEIPNGGKKPLTYRIRIRRPEVPDIETTLPVTGSIWAPDTFRGVMDLLLEKLQINPAGLPSGDNPGSTTMRELTDPTAEVIQRENGKISTGLQDHFLSPVRHEQAALLLAAFTLREHSGMFFDIRSDLCRMTAHLVFAQSLRHGAPAALEGRLAGAALAALYHDQCSALRQLDEIPNGDLSAGAWARALRIRITGDYRLAVGVADLTLLERREEFEARVRGIDPTQANRTLPDSDELRQLSDWSRILNCRRPGVEIGHEILRRSLRTELSEASNVYALYTGKGLSEDVLVEMLNAEPEQCVTGSASGTAVVRVIGWGHWAGFLQRHLCHAIQSDFDFLQRWWGVPDEARAYRESADKQFSQLRLYPFVRRQNATEEPYYRQAQDAEMAVIHQRPHLVPVAVWNDVCFKVPFAPLHIPPPHAFVNEWHRHNPPPGTAYNIFPRMCHPSLTNRKDYAELLARMHEMAPYDNEVTHYYLYQRASPGGRTPPDGPAMEQGYGPVLEFDAILIGAVAEAYRAQPARFEQWMKRAAAISPFWNYSLGHFYAAAGRDADAAHAYEQIVLNDDDSVRMSQRCEWLVQYYERTGEAAKATGLAERAAEVYSSGGLETMAHLLEKRRDFQGAIEYYSKVYERYDNPGSLIGCLLRYERATGKTDYAPALRRLVAKALPRGLEKLEGRMPEGAPKSGVVLRQENSETREAGLKLTDIIVGIRGYKAETFAAYGAIRDMEPNIPFTLIVWRNNHYIEITASPPDNRFGVEMGDYAAN